MYEANNSGNLCQHICFKVGKKSWVSEPGRDTLYRESDGLYLCQILEKNLERGIK